MGEGGTGKKEECVMCDVGNDRKFRVYRGPGPFLFFSMIYYYSHPFSLYKQTDLTLTDTLDLLPEGQECPCRLAPPSFSFPPPLITTCELPKVIKEINKKVVVFRACGGVSLFAIPPSSPGAFSPSPPSPCGAFSLLHCLLSSNLLEDLRSDFTEEAILSNPTFTSFSGSNMPSTTQHTSLPSFNCTPSSSSSPSLQMSRSSFSNSPPSSKAPTLINATFFTEKDEVITIISIWSDGSLLFTPSYYFPQTNQLKLGDSAPSKKVILPVVGYSMAVANRGKKGGNGEKSGGAEGEKGGGKLYIGGGDGKVYCFDIKTKELLWKMGTKFRKVTEMVYHPYTSELWCASSEVYFFFFCLGRVTPLKKYLIFQKKKKKTGIRPCCHRHQQTNRIISLHQTPRKSSLFISLLQPLPICPLGSL